ncbi:MAG TPA: hypothetical protein PKA77_05840 [Chitinophagaceae bacterium]|mgnify:FL=1|jgi:hypothetical protein|nr:hypothetical protein [Chitinophagaceae bacterium]HMU58345.1 hypothetical protein [Chitinophagaceae bacterium]
MTWLTQNKKRLLPVLLLLMLINASYAQQRDTSFNPHRIDIHQRNWCFDVRTGFQKRFFAGLGISKTMFIGAPHGMYGYDIYTALNIFPSFKTDHEFVLGYNAGAVMCGNFGVLGVDFQYMKSKSADDFLVTPKIGIGASLLYLVYGYSFSSNKFPIAGISQNSLMLKLNLPFYSKDMLKKESTTK